MVTEEKLFEMYKHRYIFDSIKIDKDDENYTWTWKIQHEDKLRKFSLAISRKCKEAVWYILLFEAIAKSLRETCKLVDCEISQMEGTDCYDEPNWMYYKADYELIDKKEINIADPIEE
jgi:hypothetical protein